jgi:acyl-coenzyme A thioesterase 13
MNNLEIIRSFVGKEFSASPSPFMRWLGPTVVEAREGNLVFMYVVRKEWLNPMERLHGGVTAAIIDDAIGATMFSYNEENFYTTINNVIDYFSSAGEGEKIVVETQVVKKGKRFVNAQCDVWNSNRTKLIAKGSSNLFKVEGSSIFQG